MKVLLQADVESLGQAGEIVNVSDGYARNFLIPRKLAVIADEKNLRVFEHLKRQTEEKIKKIKKQAESLAEKLSNLTLTITAKAGEEGKLFGSITSINIAEELKKQGFDIDRKKIVLEQPLKMLGDYEVKIKLEGNVSANLKLSIVKEDER
ncbi:MAG: 50S ribosomal protein L9 [Proteobacteria bacterium]|nr:50S ribosomal protein L9 [Pseudomonadota bacterium]